MIVYCVYGWCWQWRTLTLVCRNFTVDYFLYLTQNQQPFLYMQLVWLSMETLNLSTIYIMHVGVSDVKFLFSNWYFSYKPKDCQTFTSPFCHFFIVLFTMKLLLGPDKTGRCPVFRISMVSKSYWLKGIIIWWISSLILIWT